MKKKTTFGKTKSEKVQPKPPNKPRKPLPGNKRGRKRKIEEDPDSDLYLINDPWL